MILIMTSKQKLTELFFFLLVIIAVGSSGISSAQSKSTLVFLREQQLRERAKVEVLPNYPKDAKSSGIVVTEVDFDATGNITRLDVLESADPRFNAPTIKSIKQWRFNPITT